MAMTVVAHMLAFRSVVAVLLACSVVLSHGVIADAIGDGSLPVDCASRPRIVAYVTAWSAPVQIDARRITHVNFAFARIDADGRVVVPPGDAEARLRELVDVRRGSPSLRVLASVGGWGADGFSDAALDPKARDRFAESVVDLLRRYDLDGVDLDWEYPGQDVAGIVARAADRENFTRMLAAVRARIDAESRRAGREPYLLTIATADREYFEHVEMSRLHPYVDWINVMAYDFYNSLTRTTGHHAGWGRAESAPASDRWGQASIEQHLAAGVPPGKLVLGVAFYGRRFEGVEPANDGLKQGYTRYGGEHSYGDLIANYVDRDGFRRHWDERASAPWLWNPAKKVFVTYDDPQSIRLKSQFARSLGGVMFWELSQDGPGAELLAAVAAGLDVQEESRCIRSAP
jgi:chitinase